MIEPQDRPAAWRRDAQVARVRRLTRWVVAGSLGLAGLLSAVVAQALPGRPARAPATTTQAPSGQDPSGQDPSGQASSTQAPSGQAPSSLAPPAQLPAASSGPAPVVSGGS